MTAPVDIAAVVRLARAMVAGTCSACCNSMPLARALIALADERATVEQRTAEAIAKALESSPTCPCDVCEFAASSSDRAHTKRAIAAWARAGRWRTP